MIGSMTNHILTRATVGQPVPEVGMGATVLHFTDREAATIIKVERKGEKTYVTVQEDTATRIDNHGMSESQVYAYMPNPKGHTTTFCSIGPDGCWVEATYNQTTKRWSTHKGRGLSIGVRRAYHDFSF